MEDGKAEFILVQRMTNAWYVISHLWSSEGGGSQAKSSCAHTSSKPSDRQMGAEVERTAWIAPLRCVLAPSRNESLRRRDRFIARLADHLFAVALRKGGGMVELAGERARQCQTDVTVLPPEPECCGRN